MDLPETGNMSSTNSANPLACSAGLAVIEEIKNKKLIKASKEKGKILFKELDNIKNLFPKNILEVNGKGLIAAIIFRKSKNIGSTLKKVVEECLKEGLLVVYTGRESIKIGPPLTISSDALKEGLGILKKNIHKIFINNNGKN